MRYLVKTVLSKLSKGAWALPTLLLASGAQAHHSANMFDFANCRTLEGTVRKLEWQYPHNWLWIVVPSSSGAEEVWGFEFMSPVQAMGLDARWKRDAVKKGDKVTVKFGPHRDANVHAGAMSALTLPDGYVLPGSPGLCGAPPTGAGTGVVPTAKP